MYIDQNRDGGGGAPPMYIDQIREPPKLLTILGPNMRKALISSRVPNVLRVPNKYS